MAAPLDLDTLPNTSKLSLDEQILAAEKEFIAKQPKVGMASTPVDAVPAETVIANLTDAAATTGEPVEASPSVDVIKAAEETPTIVTETTPVATQSSPIAEAAAAAPEPIPEPSGVTDSPTGSDTSRHT